MNSSLLQRAALCGALTISLLGALHTFGNFDEDRRASTVSLDTKPAKAKPLLKIMSADQKVDAQILPLLLKQVGNRASLLQRTVGGAEGTRMPDGRVTSAYHGHRDPMCNWNFSSSCASSITNLGSFSYQQAPDKPRAHTPEQADRIQLQVLRLQALELMYQAKRVGVELTVLQLLAGIDLANQSPSAACVQQPDKAIVDKLAAGIDPQGANTRRATAKFASNTCRWGYIDRLAQALRGKKLSGLEAIVEARTWSYFQTDPFSYRYMRWDAAGLGHNRLIIEGDQLRRSLAVDEALTYQLKHAQLFK